eukprot:6251602-Amphidinium_carterae.2
MSTPANAALTPRQGFQSLPHHPLIICVQKKDNNTSAAPTDMWHQYTHTHTHPMTRFSKWLRITLRAHSPRV